MRTGLFLTAATAMLLTALCTTAQKLPNIQQGSVPAPAGLKIDGKANEWENFKAYNKANECFYTIANDGANLYFVIQATNHSIIQKIVAGGITLTMHPEDNAYKSAKVALTYPIVPPPFDAGVSYKLRSNPTLSEKDLADLNKQVSGHIKDIAITGAAGITDSTISVYNDLGIKAAGLIDDQKAYTCEICIPLKYIQQVINAAGTFKYRIQINGMDTSGKNGYVVVGSPGEGAAPTNAAVDHTAAYFLIAPTYLQATYTLAK